MKDDIQFYIFVGPDLVSGRSVGRAKRGNSLRGRSPLAGDVAGVNAVAPRAKFLTANGREWTRINPDQDGARPHAR